jgi:anti-sigma factor ChrR (cupin superfamily)
MHPNDDLINAYADESIEAADRGAVDAHLASCVECRQTVDDLREVLRATKALEPLDPPVRAWSRIERAIALDGRMTPGADAERSQNTQDGSDLRTSRLPRALRPAGVIGWLAAAAVLVLATVVGMRYVPLRGARPAAPQSADAGAADSARVEAELREAEAHYENAIKGLEQIAKAEQSELDPNTAATLQKNLAVIDQAISESRAAVQAQPSNEPAQQSLIENFKTKIGLLQDTVALINEMRKGNEAGAARIVSGLKNKGN